MIKRIMTTAPFASFPGRNQFTLVRVLDNPAAVKMNRNSLHLRSGAGWREVSAICIVPRTGFTRAQDTLHLLTRGARSLNVPAV